MMAFAVVSLGIHIFRTKIGESNGASLTLFRKLVSLSLSLSLWSMLLISYLNIHAMLAIRLNKISLVLAYIWIGTHVLRVDIGLVLRAFFALNQCCWFCNIWEQHWIVRKDNRTGLTVLQLVWKKIVFTHINCHHYHWNREKRKKRKKESKPEHDTK